MGWRKEVPVHLHSEGAVSLPKWERAALTWEQQSFVGSQCDSLVINKAVAAGGREAPQVEDLLNADEGRKTLEKIKGIGLRVKHQTELEKIEVSF
ncbi:MAG: hypothetical protein O2857_20875 [Planctomycetota bacterium]|nr:hypothetical protein [Planctomycetota bacterium]